mmetsp:Transcript_33120/g.105566  ORF Transcript_33120/g.105566 Transcript_33120/m.105566 type:complete len:137 (-) Transcript_33120:102-512(-)
MMIWGITPKMWGKIFCIFMVMYLLDGLYFAGLSTVALQIRDSDYLRLPVSFYGPFDRDAPYAPHGCYFGQSELPSEKDITKMNLPYPPVQPGDTFCSDNKVVWNVVPWEFFKNPSCVRSPTNGYAQGTILGKCENM